MEKRLFLPQLKKPKKPKNPDIQGLQIFQQIRAPKAMTPKASSDAL